jgi:hypothetical protein
LWTWAGADSLTLQVSGSGCSTHAAVYNTFNTQTHLIRRPTLRQFRAAAHDAWAAATQAA